MTRNSKQVPRTITMCFVASAISIGILLVGCDPYLRGTEKSWSVGDCEVYETIQRSENDWPDPHFLRTYRLKREGRTLTVGSYDNESSTGVINPPFVVGQYIVIPTSCYVYRIGSNNQINEFSPRLADQWQSFSESLRINGHYDYHADSVENLDGVWRLTYALGNGLNGHRPNFIHFVSKDDWQSFQVETEKRKSEK